MANIPGIPGYVQPGVFARDRVVSKGVSIPGGIRVLSILGEGSREVTLVESALGSGQDGVASPDGEINGRFFSLPLAPVVSGRTELRINGSLLLGEQSALSGDFNSKFDYRIDISTGDIELRGANFKDLDGKDFSASTLNVGLGTIKELILLDENAEGEALTLRCATVIRDPLGAPIPGKSKFTLTGSKSGASRDENGNQVIFTDTYKIDSASKIKRNDSLNGGLVLASTEEAGLFSSSFETSSAEMVTNSSGGTSITSGSTIYVEIQDGLGSNTSDSSDDEPLFERILVGDSFMYTLSGDTSHTEFKIEAVYRKTSSTVIKLNKPVEYDSISAGSNISSWYIKCFDAIEMPNVTIEGNDVGKLVKIPSGAAEGYYTVTAVQTSFNIIRVVSFTNSSLTFPALSQDIASQEVSLLETDGKVAIGIEKHSSAGFGVGDKFSFEIESLALSENDRLEASFIYELDLNDPEFFISAGDLVEKHGFASLDNNLSLGSQIAFENGAPGVLAVQTKPSLPRRTIETLLEEVNSAGKGGYAGSTTDPEENDLTFSIPVPFSGGIRSGVPDENTDVNIFVLRGGKETQIFPNKVGFYNSQYEDESGRTQFISDSDNAYSYTIVNYGGEIFFGGTSALISPNSDDGTKAYFYSPGANFDSDHVGKKIVIKSTALNTQSENIGEELYGSVSTKKTHELEIISIESDDTVIVANADSQSESFVSGATDVSFILIDTLSSVNTAALVLHKDLITSGTIKSGDGIRISYIDRNDADFYDVNMFEALEKLEAFSAQIVVPLPKQTKSAIFRAVVRHCELMSSIAKRRERVAIIGAFEGITADALIGRKLVAAEDIGVIEGVQGDDPEEVLNRNIEDLQDYKLSSNFTSNHCVYMYPDRIVRPINGTNRFLDGFYMAAAAGGYLSATTNVAIPLTNKVLGGFSILRDRVFRDITLNELGSVGATVVQPVTGGGRVLAGRTTSQSGYVEDEEISIIFIRDRVKTILRDSLQDFVGRVQDDNTSIAIAVRVRTIMSGLINEIIEGYENVKVERDKVDPRQMNVLLRFTPVYPVNHVFIDIEVGL
jgi:hypothetical protein